MNEGVDQVKKAERLTHLTTQSGWSDLLKIINDQWEAAFETSQKVELLNGGVEKVIEARATMKTLTGLVDSVSSEIKHGEAMKNKVKPVINR